MKDIDKKKYILSNWKTSSGKKIAIMLKRYWSLEKKEDGIIEEAIKIFDIK